VRPVHNRMPVILRQEDEEQWLDASRTPFVKAKSLLKPYPEELMNAHDVSPIVNSAKNDGPECCFGERDATRRAASRHSYLGAMRKIPTIRRVAHSRTKLSHTVRRKTRPRTQLLLPQATMWRIGATVSRIGNGC
jgi:hypothetical protein